MNQLVFSSERRLGNDAGLPRRDWFREGLEEGQWDEARQGVTKVAAAITALAEQVDRASAGLARVVK